MELDSFPIGDLRSSLSISTKLKQTIDSKFDQTHGVSDLCVDELKRQRKIRNNHQKHKRRSLWAASTNASEHLVPTQSQVHNIFTNIAKNFENVLPFNAMFPRESLRMLQSSCEQDAQCVIATAFDVPAIMNTILSFFNEWELLCRVSSVSSRWADAATFAHANLLSASVVQNDCFYLGEEADEDELDRRPKQVTPSLAIPMERSWSYVNNRFPWGCFLAEGAFKQVYKVYNSRMGKEEAISVM
jgi:hypothetical protein